MTDPVASYCRLCASCIPINKLVKLSVDDEVCTEIVRKLVRVGVSPSASDLFENDNLPKAVCFACLSALESTVDFLIAVDKAQKILSNIFSLREVDTEISNDISTESVFEDFEPDLDPTPQTVVKQEQDAIGNCREKKNEIPKNKISLNSKPNPSKHCKRKVTQGSNNYTDVAIIPPSQGNSTWSDYIWTCLYCETQFSHVEELKMHSINYHQACSGYKCTDCTTSKLRLKKFIIHIKKHRTYLKLSCYICSAKYSSPVSLGRHVKTHFRTKHVCVRCNTSFPNVEEFRKHCSMFDSYKNIKSKCNSADRPRDYACDKCGKSFYTKNSLINHMVIHEDARPFQCDICKVRFKRRSQIAVHVGIHYKQKPYSCDKCGKCFRLKNHLNSHSIVHTDSLPYVCSLCNKSFRFKSIWKLHSLQHTGEMPYSCNICQRNFTNWSNYNKHMKRLHNIDMSKKKRKSSDVLPVP